MQSNQDLYVIDKTRCTAGTIHLSPTHEPRLYSARFVTAGRIKAADQSDGPFEIPLPAIRDAAAQGKFDGRPTFIDHASFFEGPSLKDLAGTTQDATFNATTNSADGTIRLFDNPPGDIIASLFDQVLSDADEGLPVPDVGLSLVFWPQWKPRDTTNGSGDPLVLHSFRHIESVDFVFQPAADGRILDALTALSAIAPDRSAFAVPPDQPAYIIRSETMPPERDDLPLDELDNADPQPPTPPATPPTPTAPNAGANASALLGLPADPWADALSTHATSTIIAGSGLPPAIQQLLNAQTFGSPEDLDAAIEAHRQALADLVADNAVDVGGVPPRGQNIALGRNSLEQVQAAFDALIDGTSPPSGVQPLTGLRELYHILSGDYEMHGIYQPDRIYLANVNSSTMAGIVANALNKAVVNAFAVYPQWWAPLVTEMNFSTLQDVRWITLGGVGELPTVAEGAAYTELTWDDQTETDSFVKKGGYLGLTIEAIDKDDVGQLRAAPRALGQAAWLTLSKTISAIFTTASGTGPTMSDSNVLFDATNHSNLLTTALSWSEYVTVRTAMMKQTEVNSGERLGALTAPYYLVVPVDLEVTALQILASEGEPGTADNDINPLAEGNDRNSLLGIARKRVIVCPLWTDTNNWAAVADPRLYPSIGIGYRYGSTPEIFSVASPTAGLMFTNDTMPIKVRFFYAAGPTDWRGLHKSNVS